MAGVEVSIEDVLITGKLAKRPPRQPDLAAENRAFRELSRQIAREPQQMLMRLCRAAVELCAAGSAGVSLLEVDDSGREIFRWVAVAGVLESEIGTTTSRDFSPCGSCLDRDAPQLFFQPARRFRFLDRGQPAIVEALVISFHGAHGPLGTIWITSHEPTRHFDAEDVRIMKSLGEFTSAALKVMADAKRVEALCRELEIANRRKDEFLAILGHELRNPLAPILTALQLMKLRGSDTFVRERAIIERQVRHVTRLVDDLLDVSRVIQGKIQLRRERVELNDVIAKAVELASPVLEQRRHRFQVTLPETPVLLDGDAIRLSQVVTNLLNNAAKYTNPGGSVELLADVEGGMLVVRVRDDGVGIAPEMVSRIFELFAQGDQKVSRPAGGLGIGLALVKSLVELHGGSVAAHSDGLGHGSEFVVRLPAANHAVQAATEERDSRWHSIPDGERSSKRVLIVDDNRDAAEMLSEALNVMGYETDIAHDGPAALVRTVAFQPDVVLLDIGLPVMDGYEVARRVRAEYGCESPRLIAVTGYGQRSDRVRSAEAGFAEHVVKPIDLSMLVAAIDGENAASGRRAHDVS